MAGSQRSFWEPVWWGGLQTRAPYWRLGLDGDGEVGAEVFEGSDEGLLVEVGGDADDAGGVEDGVAGHGGGLEIGVELFDVAAGCGDGCGEGLDDAGAVVAHDVETEAAVAGGGGGGFLDGVDGEATGTEVAEGFEEGGDLCLGTLDTEDASEVSGELGHAGFEPTAVMIGDGGGEGVDQTGAVGADDRHDEGGHGGKSYPLSVISYWGGSRRSEVSYSTVTGVPMVACS